MMDKVDRLAQVRLMARNDHDAVTMLLSACADMANGNGVLLSVRAFDQAADMIISYFAIESLKAENARLLRLLDSPFTSSSS